MRAGKLRHRVSFRQPIEDTGDGTDNPDTWIIVKTVDADVRPVSIKEINAAQGLVMQTDVAVECRYLPELSGMDNQWMVTITHFPELCRVVTATNPDYQKRMIRAICRFQSLYEAET